MDKVIRKDRATIDEKIDSLIEWRKKYPQITIRPALKDEELRKYAKTDEEYNIIKEEYNKMLKYYNYVKDRKSSGYLNEEQISKCKEGNIGGVFGYPTKVEELAKKYDISEEDIDYILNKFGTIDNFYEMYNKHEIYEQKDNNLAKRIIKNAIDVDNKANSGYDRLWLRLRGDYDSQSAFYSSEELKKAIDKHLTEREKFILENRYGLVDNQKTKTLEAIGKELHISDGRTRQIEVDAIRKLRRINFLKKLFIRYTFDYSSEFITEEERDEIEGIKKDIRLQNGDLDKNLSKLEKMKNKMEKIIEYRKKEKKRKEIIERILEGKYPIDEIIRLSYEDLLKLGLAPEQAEKIVLEIKKYEEIDLSSKKQNMINNLGLSTKTYNCLRGAGILTISELAEKTPEDLVKIRNLGRKSVEEILDKMREYEIHIEFKESENNESKEKLTGNSEKSKLIESILKKQKYIAWQEAIIKSLLLESLIGIEQ